MEGAAPPLSIGFGYVSLAHLYDLDQTSSLMPVASCDLGLKLAHGRLLGVCRNGHL
jgi:hypothetical protein